MQHTHEMASMTINTDTGFALGAVATNTGINAGDQNMAQAGLTVMAQAYTSLRDEHQGTELALQVAVQLLQQTVAERDTAQAAFLVTSTAAVATTQQLQQTQADLDALRNSFPVRLANRCQQIAKSAIQIGIPVAIMAIAGAAAQFYGY